jgi:peptidoglycan/xylan/chitin deacetylase (PgdA/CDA1 family)
MFHRVVASGSSAARTADPNYTLSADLFASCLAFFQRHYSVIGLDAVRASLAGGPALPPRALLITFDDGWRDNLEVALPLLRRAGLPSAIFLATDAVADPQPYWWQEILLRALRKGHATLGALWAAAGSGSDGPPANCLPEYALLMRYAALPAAERLRPLTFYITGMASEGRHMLATADLPALSAGGVAIGAHGAAHLPLSLLVGNAEADLMRSRQALAELGHGCGVSTDTLSFPHGKYDAAVLRAAAAAGFRIMFTSDACLNAAPGGRPASALLGRISIEALQISDESGALVPARLATWLFNRPVRRLGMA